MIYERVAEWLLQRLAQKASDNGTTLRRHAGSNPVTLTDFMNLKPCPFCGSDASIDHHRPYRHVLTGELEDGVSVSCEKCSAEIMICQGEIPDFDKEQLGVLVAERWNTRAPVS